MATTTETMVAAVAAAHPIKPLSVAAAKLPDLRVVVVVAVATPTNRVATRSETTMATITTISIPVLLLITTLHHLEFRQVRAAAAARTTEATALLQTCLRFNLKTRCKCDSQPKIQCTITTTLLTLSQTL